MGVSLPRVSTLAVAGLIATGLFLIAISVPPLYNAIFGEEPNVWEPVGVANGFLYLAAAGLVRARSRIGVGLAIVLGSLGFTLAFGLALSRLDMGLSVLRGEASVSGTTVLEIIVLGLLVAAHGVVVVGVIDGARRWRLVELDTRRGAAAALLAGIGFALGLGVFGGEYAILLSPITMPPAYRIVEYTIVIPHFVAFAAIALSGRFATILSIALIVAGILIGIQVLAALVGWQHGVASVLDTVALWTLLLAAWAAAGLLLLASAWTDVRGPATPPLVPDQT